MPPSPTILGIRFFAGTPAGAVRAGGQGGLVVVPSAPVLSDMERSPELREALTQADLALTDSGFMVLLWRWLTGERLTRVSGLEYLRLLLHDPAVREPGATFWIMPSTLACERNLHWLRSEGLPVTAEDTYIAPVYPPGAVADPTLLGLLTARAPRHIIIALGGGTQERLGLYLKRHLPGRPGIHCIGAAIGFCSGDQVRIPLWADGLYLGWLFRCLSDPRKFVPRYWEAKRLAGLLWRSVHRRQGVSPHF